MQKFAKRLLHLLPIILILTAIFLVFHFQLNTYLSFSSLKNHRMLFFTWTQQHYFLTVLAYMGIYILAVMLSIPGAVFLTIAGGFLFGLTLGTLYVVVSATIGATLIFLIVQFALNDWLSKKSGSWITKMQHGFQENAFQYLLVLRLVPLFPFWIVNIVPALLNVRIRTFIMATFIGIIPGSFVYITVGNGVGHLLSHDQVPNLAIIFSPQILLPLMGLAFLSLIPILYKRTRRANMKGHIQCDIAIIGGGSGGLSLAAGASQLGAKVVLIESDKMGGDCLNYGCVPSKTLLSSAKRFWHAKTSEEFGLEYSDLNINFSKVMNNVRHVIETISPNDSIERFEKLGVKVIKARGKFIDDRTLQAGNEIIKAKRFVIATGSSPFIPPIPGLKNISFETNETIFNLKIQPSHLIVIGGGPIGSEIAQAFAMLGSKVTILELFNILPKDDIDCVAIIRNQMEEMGVVIHENIKIEEISKNSDGAITVTFEINKKSHKINGSHLLLSTGRKVNLEDLDLETANINYSPKGIDVNSRLRSSNKKVYAIGDAAGSFQFTHVANYHAGIVLKNILFRLRSKVDYRAVPWVTYTEPEMAHVGMLAIDAMGCRDTKITEWPFSDNDRAQTEHATIGKIKVITDKKGKIVGVTIVGPHAGDLILPWVIAVRERKTLRTFTDTIIPYPTLSEVSKRVAGLYYTPVLFSSKVKMLVKYLLKLG